ncbi:MAG TPA: DNA repair protein RecO [Beijerinckiaceae bacterium]|jgi:DNA repair protein RecO (recombination protein O)
MEWRDEGVVIGLKRHGESSVIVEAMTRLHGRHMGIVKGGRSRRMQPFLQPGNSVGLVWRARLEEHLGLYVVEPLRERAGELLESGLALCGVSLLGDWLRFLPERDPHEPLWAMAETLADTLRDETVAPALMVRFELAVLSELGFGLDLDRCALTGAGDDLRWVSPRTGRAVSAAAGAPWADRLLPLPAFLCADDPTAPPPLADVLAGFDLVGRFLQRDVLSPRGLGEPDSRRMYISKLRAAASASRA